MKLLTKEQEDAHYHAVVRGGILGGALGLGVGLGGTVLLHRRLPFFRQLTLPLKTFFVTSSGTFFAIVNADRHSRRFEVEQNKEAREYEEFTQRLQHQREAEMTAWERAKEFGREYRYPIVTTSWLASMAGSLAWVSRDKYLTTAQKLVQARMYAQGLTLLVLIATAAFEVSDAKARKNEPAGAQHPHHEHYRGEDLWKDMVSAEEKRLEERKQLTEKMVVNQK